MTSRSEKYWQQYMAAFEQCLGATSTGDVPWYVVPRQNARLIVSQIVLDTFEELKMSYPKTTAARRKTLLAIRKGLAS
jgi:polyphosphate kinase 2 (PPK2 family)